MPELLVSGQRLAYERFGAADPARPTLVLLHEGLGSVSAWRDFPARLAEATGCPVFAYDRLGYGRSARAPLPRPARFMHDEAYAVLPAVLDAAGLDDVVLVGHSDGASIALLYAAEGDPRVRGAAVLAPHVLVEPVCVEAIAALRERYARDERLRAGLARHHGERTDEVVRGWTDVWLSDEFRAWNIEAVLPRVRVPLLLLQGEDDEYGTLAHIDAIRRAAPTVRATVLLPSCGHSPHRDQPAATLAALERFVAGVTPR